MLSLLRHAQTYLACTRRNHDGNVVPPRVPDTFWQLSERSDLILLGQYLQTVSHANKLGKEFSEEKSIEESSGLWADCRQLLILSEAVCLIKDCQHASNGDIVGEKTERAENEGETVNVVRSSGEKNLDDNDARTTKRDRREICSDSSRLDHYGGGLQ